VPAIARADASAELGRTRIKDTDRCAKRF